MSETTAENQPERLIVKNFGPLKDVDIELKDIMVFIGPQASGKSTLAKILYNVISFPILLGEKEFKESFNYTNNINFFTGNTLIETFNVKGQKLLSYSNEIFQFNAKLDGFIKELSTIIKLKQKVEDSEKEIKKLPESQLLPSEKSNIINKIEKDLSEIAHKIEEIYPKHKELIPVLEKQLYSYFVPAERNIISNLSDSIMGVLATGISIPKFILDFGGKFEVARQALGKTYIDFLNVTYEYSFEAGNRVFISPKKSISLSETASGLQSAIPLYLVIKHFAINKCLVIEEPELNLFPETQKKLVEFIIETCRDKTKRLIITTHSPYILTTLNGLIQAHNTARTKPELKDKVAEIVPENRWIDFDKIGVYHVADGTVKRIMNDENRLIDANPIDDVSDQLSCDFGELLDLEYNDNE